MRGFEGLTVKSGILLRNNREVGYLDNSGYRRFGYKGKRYLIHIVIYCLSTGDWPEYPAYEVDHRDGNGLNNKIENLRKVSKSQNLSNAKVRFDSSTGIKGG